MHRMVKYCRGIIHRNIFQFLCKYDSFQSNLLYSSSFTGSSHSFELPSAGTSTAKWENQLSGAAPCQCFTSGGMFTTSPGFIS